MSLLDDSPLIKKIIAKTLCNQSNSLASEKKSGRRAKFRSADDRNALKAISATFSRKEIDSMASSQTALGLSMNRAPHWPGTVILILHDPLCPSFGVRVHLWELNVLPSWLVLPDHDIYMLSLRGLFETVGLAPLLDTTPMSHRSDGRHGTVRSRWQTDMYGKR
jgi:hypothetical protein